MVGVAQSGVTQSDVARVEAIPGAWRDVFARRPVILASRSPRRTALLDQVGVSHRVCPASGRELRIDGRTRPEVGVVAAARAKAAAVAPTVHSGLVVAADTVVVVDGDVLGKPATAAQAAAMLRRLSGREHEVYTGLSLCLRPEDRWGDGWECTRVHFAPIPEPDIAAYVADGAPLDRAGAYGIQDVAALWVTRIDGCYTNVVGLPLARLYQLTRDIYDLSN